MNDYEKTCFILSGMNSEYVIEFNDVYDVFLEFTYKLIECKEKRDKNPVD